MVHLEQAQPEQLQELLAFAEEAFRTPEGKVDFPTLLPKLYGPGADSAPLHTVLYEDGAPAGLYCLKIQDFNIAGTALRVGGIGTVCVDGRSRGKGHLALLMQDAQERMQAAGCDIAMLGGQRQRYERFGYVPAGAHWEFTLTPRNVRDIRTGGVALALWRNTPAGWRAPGHCMKSTRNVRPGRGASFLTVLQSWRAEPYAVLQDGMFAGYCALAEGKPPRLQEAGAAGCGAAAGLCGGPGTAYGSCRCTCTALPVAAGGACLFCLCGGTGRLCAKPQLPRFPLGGCGPRRNGAAAHL
ncbi:MAG: GNAT family N-acetyltransferase [Ruthenibacterium lactatiformans]